MKLVSKACTCVAVLALAAASAAAQTTSTGSGQAYPAKPLRAVVGFAAGGSTDVIARIVAQRLSTHLGQQIVIENRGGADGVLAAENVARSAPDGYTLLITPSGHAINPSLYKLSFDTARDFAPVGLIADAANFVTVHPSLPVNTLKEFIDYAKARPEQIRYASSASAIHLATELLNMMAGIKTVRVPYKGSGPGVPALLSGEVQLFVTSIVTMLPHVKAGKAKALAVTSERRSALTPDIPTVSEAGVPGYVASTWYGMLTRAGTPPQIVNRLNADLRKVLDEPEVRAQLLKQGAEPVPNSPQEFSRYIAAEMQKWAKVVKETGAKID